MATAIATDIMAAGIVIANIKATTIVDRAIAVEGPASIIAISTEVTTKPRPLRAADIHSHTHYHNHIHVETHMRLSKESRFPEL